MFFSVVSGCGPVPLNSEKPVSRAVHATFSTELGRYAHQATVDAGGKTAFAPLASGNEALGARLRLIEAAQQTLDLQYFLIKPDLGGALISKALLAAADRGVRVRFLLDDVFTTVKDHDLALLDAHPNIELRIYNPSARPGPKAAGFLIDFKRVNRRMHNKSFTADSAYSILGGRNIADEYFQLDTDSQFADFEMLVVGPAVKKIAEVFDLFWNDGWAVPIDQLRDSVSAEELAGARIELDKRLIPARQTYQQAINDPYILRLNTGDEPLYYGHTEVVTDRPAKLKVPVQDGQRVLAEKLLNRFKNAKSDVILLTPYFVPEDYGARLFSDLAARGVRVRIITNSLESTNHAYVHAGYRRHRAHLTKAGVELYEIRADSLAVLGLLEPGEDTSVIMHTKLAIIDGREMFFGSLNLDPRSIKLNSEVGVFVQSRELASVARSALESDIKGYTYRVDLSASGDLVWRYSGAGVETVTSREPGATFWKQFIVGMTELMSIELQL